MMSLGRAGWVALTLLSIWAVGLAAAGRKAPFRLLYNNDATNVLSCNSPFHTRGEPLTDAAIAGSIDEVADRGVDACMLSPGLGHFPWWKSKAVPAHYPWWVKRTGLEPDAYGKYILAGGDWVKVLVERCRRHGMAPFVSLRLNDVHHLEHAGTKHPNSIWSSRFYTEHPQFWIVPDQRTRWPSGYNHNRGLNWAEPAVRSYKLAFIAELCEQYDLAGFELDFLRDHVMFRKGFPLARRAAIIADFVREVRTVLDRTAKGGPRRWLSARVPLELRRWPETGLDVRRLVDAGVDMLNCSGWFHTIPWSGDLATIRKLAPGVAIYQEMTHSAGTVWFIAGRHGYSTLGHPRTSDTQFTTTANLAYAHGADGISLFNFVYYRSGAPGLPWLEREPPFHLLPRLRDPAWLAEQPQYCWLGAWAYVNQMNRSISPGAARVFRIDLALPKRMRRPAARLRLHAADPLDAAELAVQLNGTALEPTQDTGDSFGNPYDRMISDASRRRAWTVPTTLLRQGINTIRVSVKKAKRAAKITWIDMAIH